MNSIPKIIHQTWKTEDIPTHFDELISTWKKHHPEWEYRLWTDEMNLNFIINHYPEFLKVYERYPNNIQRVDAVRYFILRHFGGVYVDIDFECLKNVGPLLDGKLCVFGIEPDAHANRFHMPYIVCNAFMACCPNHDFFNRICTELSLVSLKEKNTKVDILKTTGPFILTDLYKNYNQKQNITLLAAELIYPLTMEEIRKALTEEIDEDMQQRLDLAFAVHYFWGTWWAEIQDQTFKC